jgi:ABC-type sugar transport system permease subunit
MSLRPQARVPVWGPRRAVWRRTPARRIGGHSRWAAAFLAPSVGLIAVFILVPIVLTLWLSLHRWSTATPFGDAEWIGLKNFDVLLEGGPVGRDFRQALRNTFVYAGLSIALILPLAVLFGLIVHRATLRGTTVLRTVLFSTYTVPMIAVAIVWSKLYSPTEGPVNQALGWFGIGPQPWLSSTGTALISIVFLNVWQQVGYFTVLVVAGLTQISPSVYEAAALDGARGVRLLLRITLPLLRRTLLFCAVIALINAIQVFEPVAAITQGGPVGSTNVLTYHIREVGIERSQGGLASAMAVTLLLALLVAVTLVFALARRRDD